jgi:hypothetical protein
MRSNISLRNGSLRNGFYSLAAAAAVLWPVLARAQTPDPVGSPGDTFTPPQATPRSVPPSTDTYANVDEPKPSRAGRVSGFMGWTFNVPLGSVRDFTNDVSPLGFELQFKGWLLDQLALGVSGEWVTYVDEQPRETFSVDRAAITATLYNYVQTTSARFLVHYYFLERGWVRPFIGPHLGVSWSSFELEAADLALSDSEVSVNFGGEAGLEIPLGRYAPVALLNVRYSFSPEAEFRNTVSNVQSLGFMVGIGF